MVFCDVPSAKALGYFQDIYFHNSRLQPFHKPVERRLLGFGRHLVARVFLDPHRELIRRAHGGIGGLRGGDAVHHAGEGRVIVGITIDEEREKTWAWIWCGWIHGKYMRFLGLNGPDPFDLINGSDLTAFKLI